MYNKVNYSLVGFFVLMFIIGIVSFVLWLGQHGMKEDYKTYKLLMKDSVSGLSKDSVVRLRGVNIGRVKEIKINPEDISIIEVILDIKQEVPIKEDMRAHTEMMGITGLKSIEIDGGTNSSKELVSVNGEIPIIKTSQSLFNKTTKNVSGIFEKIDVLVSQFQLLLSNKNIKDFSALIVEYKNLAIEGKELKKSAEITLSKFDTAIERFNTSVEKGVNTFTFMQEDFRKITERSLPAISHIDKAAVDIDRAIIKGEFNFDKILEPMLVDISIISHKLSNTAEEIQESPSDLFFKSRKKVGGPGE